MMNRIPAKWIWLLICDNCRIEREVEGGFEEIIQYMKDNKWRTSDASGKWKLYCPDCENKYAKDSLG